MTKIASRGGSYMVSLTHFKTFSNLRSIAIGFETLIITATSIWAKNLTKEPSFETAPW